MLSERTRFMPEDDPLRRKSIMGVGEPEDVHLGSRPVAAPQIG